MARPGLKWTPITVIGGTFISAFMLALCWAVIDSWLEGDPVPYDPPTSLAPVENPAVAMASESARPKPTQPKSLAIGVSVAQLDMLTKFCPLRSRRIRDGRRYGSCANPAFSWEIIGDENNCDEINLKIVAKDFPDQPKWMAEKFPIWKGDPVELTHDLFGTVGGKSVLRAMPRNWRRSVMEARTDFTFEGRRYSTHPPSGAGDRDLIVEIKHVDAERRAVIP